MKNISRLWLDTAGTKRLFEWEGVKYGTPIASCLFFLGAYSANAAEQTRADWKRYVLAHPKVVYPEVVKRTGMQGMGLFVWLSTAEMARLAKFKC